MRKRCKRQHFGVEDDDPLYIGGVVNRFIFSEDLAILPIRYDFLPHPPFNRGRIGVFFVIASFITDFVTLCSMILASGDVLERGWVIGRRR